MNLPNFSAVKTAQIETQLTDLLAHNQKVIQDCLNQPSYSWANLMQPLEDCDERLHQFWSIVSHLHSVVDNEELRNAYNNCLPKLAEYSTSIGHNKKLFEAINSLFSSGEFENYDEAQKRIIENAVRDFKLAGVHLNAEEKELYGKIVARLSQVTSEFEQNILDATHAWHKQITNPEALSGIPQHAIEMAKQSAEEKKLEGYVFTLEAPSYSAVIKYADSRTLRKEMYHAYVTRASDVGPLAGKWDNSENMREILNLRLRLSKLLGFSNYADHSLATKMARSTDQVLQFLNELVDASLPTAQQEFKALINYAKQELDMPVLEAWDIAYVSEKLREKKYAISQEDLRPYFPEPRAVDGLFSIVKKLFNLDIRPVENADVWHKDAKCFAIYDENNTLKSYFYFDLYARPNKRGGAWMDDYCGRRKLANGDLQIPVAFVTCNFSGPVGDKPALFTHDDVVTLFHEFGHALQHMLTRVNYRDVAGINGIPWDAVEVASQFFENYAWEKEALYLIAQHYVTKHSLSPDLFAKMQRARNFQSAMQMLRQVEFSLFDFMLHMEFNPAEEKQIQKILSRIRNKISVVPVPDFNRFQHSFSHIFAGGYAAGYYSYKWAEVMAADAFELFLQTGIFNQELAKKYQQHILEPGGTRDFSEMFAAFRGREPNVQALLKHNGII